MKELNSVYLFGRVVKDAELKKTKNNESVVPFSIACKHSFKKDNEWVNQADFFSLAIYGEYAEKKVADLKKGQKVIIEGCLRQNKWEKDGIKHNDIIIRVLNIQLIFDSAKADQSLPPEENASAEFTEEQLAEMYASEKEILSNSGEDIF